MFFHLLPDFSERLRNETRHIKRQLNRRRSFVFGKLLGTNF